MRATAYAALLLLVLVGCAGTNSATAPPAASAGAGTSSSGATSSSAAPEILPILINSEILKGPNRFLFSLTDRANKLIAAPDVKVRLRFYNVDVAKDTVAFEKDARFIWAIENETGLYVAQVDYPAAGRWGTRFEATLADGSLKSVRADYDVAASGTTPALGAKAPSIDTPTLAEVGGNVAAVSTDKEPLLRMYETSIADALAAGKPFVVSFATPAFCETRLCGPALDSVKAVAATKPNLTFINVEPYRMKLVDGRLQPELSASGELQAAPWTTAWGLVSEPYTFVIAADGTVAGKLEGVFAQDELAAALENL